MENSKDGNSVHENPKPTDQVQMEIETVTPDTEKDVVPTVENNQSPKKTNEVPDSQQTNTAIQKDNEQTADIETVVPDKAKADATATKTEESNHVDTAADKPAGNAEANNEETKLEEEEVKATTTDNNEQTKVENESENNQDEGDDERDQIETVSP